MPPDKNPFAVKIDYDDDDNNNSDCGDKPLYGTATMFNKVILGRRCNQQRQLSDSS
jgi:hypothetical protein